MLYDHYAGKLILWTGSQLSQCNFLWQWGVISTVRTGKNRAGSHRHLPPLWSAKKVMYKSGFNWKIILKENSFWKALNSLFKKCPLRKPVLHCNTYPCLLQLKLSKVNYRNLTAFWYSNKLHFLCNAFPAMPPFSFPIYTVGVQFNLEVPVRFSVR